MKKLAFLLMLLVALVNFQSVQAQNTNWVALHSDITALTAPGQPVSLTLNASLNTSISGAALILRYDPACFKITGHQPGSLLPGATAFVQEQPGQLDLTYYFLGKGQGLTGEGSLIAIQLETLKLCASDLSTAPETISLGVLDEKGMAFNLPGVEYRTLTVHLAPSQGQAVAAAGQEPASNAASGLPSESTASQPASQNAFGPYLTLLPFASLPIIGVITYFLLRRPAKQDYKASPFSAALPAANTPALVHVGGSVPLSQPRTRLGRHAEIIQQDGGFYVADTGSQKGTFLNGNRLGAGHYPLHDGDQIQLGREVSYRFVEPRRRVVQYP